MILVLPRPPSVNNLFVTVKSLGAPLRVRGKPYREWVKLADGMLWGQHLEYFQGPVRITILVEDKGQGDLDNFCKATLDFLVRHNIIEDDCRKIVRSITMKWADIEGARVEVCRVAAPQEAI